MQHQRDLSLLRIARWLKVIFVWFYLKQTACIKSPE
jgi:hypothetical protein